jgi:hypothetical protein
MITYKEAEACDRSKRCCNSSTRQSELTKVADHHVGDNLQRYIYSNCTLLISFLMLLPKGKDIEVIFCIY